MDAVPDTRPSEPLHMSKTGELECPQKLASSGNCSSDSTQSTNDGRSSNEDDGHLHSSRSRSIPGRHDVSSDDTLHDECRAKVGEAGGSPSPPLHPSLERNGPRSSKGSALHNVEGCKPCAFYCFSHGGCYAGDNCNFCHLFHKSRSKPLEAKEMRANAHNKSASRQRFVSNLGERGVESNESSRQRDDSSKSSQSHSKRLPPRRVTFDEAVDKQELVTDVVKNSQTGPEDPTTFQRDFSLGAPHSVASLPAGISFTYVPEAALVRVGQRVDLLPFLDSSQPRIFAVSPELPPGLTIDKFTGVISGVPRQAARVSSVHFITCCEPLVSFNIQTAMVRLEVDREGVSPISLRFPNPQLKDNSNPELQVQLQQLHQMLGALRGAVTGLAMERGMQQQQQQEQPSCHRLSPLSQ